MSRISKIIKGKKGYFVQRSDAQLIFDKKLKQHVYETEFIKTAKLVEELREQFEEGYPISADEKVLEELSRLIENREI